MKDLKHLPISFDAKAVKDDGSFEGYASTFGNIDNGYDMVMPGAFTESLKKRHYSKIKMLWQHRQDEPIGIWEDAKEDDKGLFVKGKLLKEVQRGAEAYALMKAGVIDSMSIGFRTMDSDFDKSGVRRLIKLDLAEISLVTFPMNEEATISAVKEFNPREMERGLREVGLSRSDAVKAVAYFRDRLRDAGETVETDPREAEKATQEALAAVFQDAARRLLA